MDRSTWTTVDMLNEGLSISTMMGTIYVQRTILVAFFIILDEDLAKRWRVFRRRKRSIVEHVLKCLSQL